MAQKTPTYDYNADPLTSRNQSAAQARGWTWDNDWHDYVDEHGLLVHGRFHERPARLAALDPTALK